MKNRVLIIEDETATSEMLQKALQTKAITALQAADGDTALQMMKPGEFDLVVLDLKLPGMSGDQLLEKLRKIDPYVDVIVYTNYQNPPVMKRLFPLGVSGYIQKGADADLWEIVRQIQDRLEPFSAEERDEVLKHLPPEGGA
jgi:DNA-binding NarL/FixJ family response regulator